MRTVKFLGENCTISFARYPSGMPAIQLTCECGEPMAKATVNIPEAYGPYAGTKTVFIKDYAENNGILDALMGAGIIGKPMDSVPCGYEFADVCELLIDPETH